jgi:hypothetical protein
MITKDLQFHNKGRQYQKVEKAMSEETKTSESEANTETVEVKAKFEGTPVPPNIFVDLNEKILVEVDVVSDASNGKITWVFPKDQAPKDENGFFVFTPISFGFSFPTYDQISGYRQRSTNNQGRMDENLFRSFLLVQHLKSWDVKDKKGNVVELDFEATGELSKEALENINRVPTIVWDKVLSLFESEAKISGFRE